MFADQPFTRREIQSCVLHLCRWLGLRSSHKSCITEGAGGGWVEASEHLINQTSLTGLRAAGCLLAGLWFLRDRPSIFTETHDRPAALSLVLLSK